MLPFKFYKFFLLFFLALFYSKNVQAGACCGAGVSAGPNIITGDVNWQTQLGLSRQEWKAQANSAGTRLERSKASQSSTQALRLDLAYRFFDFGQVNLSLPLLYSPSLLKNSSSQISLGDLALGLVYEFMPELSYHPWKPKGFFWVQVQLPFLRQVLDESAGSGLSNNGNGSYAFSAGFLFSKVLGRFDAFANPAFQWRLPNEWQEDQDIYRSSSQGVFSNTLGLGYSPVSSSRLGLRLQNTWQAAKTLELAWGKSQVPASELYLLGFDLAYFLNDEISFLSSWSPLALSFGKNVVLAETYSLSFVYRSF